MKINLFGTDIKLKEQHCKKNDCEVVRIDDPYLNIYVRITNVCNASCGFCAYHGKETPFDLYKLYYILMEISSKIQINKLSCTGGEPTLEVDRIKAILNKTKEISPSTFTVISTNGHRLHQLDRFDAVDSIAVSRHAITDGSNQKIFGTHDIATSLDISDFEDKDKLHLSCNLMRHSPAGNVVNSADAAIRYLDSVAKIGVRDVGFVTLMPVTKAAQINTVAFENFDFSNNGNIFQTQKWNDHDRCQCCNYLYSPPDIPAVVKVYARQNLKPHESVGCLVYDGQYLRKTFGGDVII